jgi:tetratricopeptide (TPR) repeat protein
MPIDSAHPRSRRGQSGALAALAILLTCACCLGGCAKVGQLKAMKAFKNANQAYQRQDYKKAAELYEEAVAASPELTQAYFYLGNSYDNLWKPSKKGDPANDALLDKAADNYRKAAERLSTDKPEDAKLKTLSLQYLVATYGPDKLNDPSKAEPVVERLIQADPSDLSSYFALAKIDENAGAVDKAEQILARAKQARPNDPAVYLQLAAFYNRQNQFDKTIQALDERAAKEPGNPEAFYTIATYYWDKAYRDTRVKEPQKREFVRKGLEAIDRALQIKPDYMEALVYKNLLLRLQANAEKDRAKQAALIKQADQLRERAEALRKEKAAG